MYFHFDIVLGHALMRGLLWWAMFGMSRIMSYESWVVNTIVTCHHGFVATISTSKRCCIVAGDIWVFFHWRVHYGDDVWSCFRVCWIIVATNMELINVFSSSRSYYVVAAMSWWFDLLFLRCHGLCCCFFRGESMCFNICCFEWESLLFLLI